MFAVPGRVLHCQGLEVVCPQRLTMWRAQLLRGFRNRLGLAGSKFTVWWLHPEARPSEGKVTGRDLAGEALSPASAVQGLLTAEHGRR